MIEKYGVDNAFKSEFIKKKIKNTMVEKYGVKHPAQSDIIKEKIRNTNIEKYGVSHPLKNPDIYQKVINSCLERYNVEYCMQSNEIRKKAENTNLQRYGGVAPAHADSIKKKMMESRTDHNGVPCSTQQKYLNNLYNGELNYYCDFYAFDIYLPQHNLDIEYNGGGHNLMVKLGNMSQSEFDQKEIIRSNIIKRKGFKQMTIISLNDKLPSDEILLQMLDKAINYFNSTTHSWIEFDIDNSTYRNAQEGTVSYDCGKLRTIKKTDIPDIDNNITDIQESVS
jgi:hypothetical protein